MSWCNNSSFDHRLIDEATAAKFLENIRESGIVAYLKSPSQC
ncbi:2-oxo acid dehydrogenase subunit E2 [Thermoanaerobacter kivui]